jgi:hypothetical protein
MPKCLDCNQTKVFWYTEVSHKLGTYNEQGGLENVIEDYYDDVLTSSGICGVCKSTDIEGNL